MRWKGFNELFDSWEPAANLVGCAKALKAWETKKKRLSKSRSRSRGRPPKLEARSKSRSKSKSRSRSRARKLKTEASQRSRSRSLCKKRSSSKSTSKVVVLETQSPPQEKSVKQKLSRECGLLPSITLLKSENAPLA